MSYFARLKKFFWFFAKLAIAGGIVAYLILRNPTEILDGFRNFQYAYLLPALAVYLFHMLVCTWRWHRLTRILQVKLSGFEALSLTMQGYFFSLVIPGGEFFFLLGPSGCGKSTLLRILAGLVRPDAGEIFFNGRSITGLPPEQRRAAMVFQNYALWPHLSVYENVAFGLQAEKRSSSEIRKRVLEALDTVRLADAAERRVPSLSGGQQQRVALARALAVEPALLLLDEPLSNLDAKLRDEMRLEIRRIAKERQLTALYVTHDRREALSMADRLALLHQGVLQQTGTPEEVYLHPRSRFAAEFLGGANFLAGRVIRPGVAATALGEFPVPASEPVGSELELLIRPEHLRFARPGSADGGHRFVATPRSRTFLGEHCEWQLEGEGVALTLDEAAPRPRELGVPCEFEFDPDGVVVLKE